MADNNKLSLVVEIDVNKANASIKTVNVSLSSIEQAAAKAARGASSGIDGMTASMMKGAAAGNLIADAFRTAEVIALLAHGAVIPYSNVFRDRVVKKLLLSMPVFPLHRDETGLAWLEQWGSIGVNRAALSGIGESTARLLAGSGAKVVLGARRTDRIDALVKDITAKGDAALSFQADVTKRSEVEALVQGAIHEYGRIDVIVNNAGMSPAR